MTVKQLLIGKTEDSRIQIARNVVVEAIRIGVNSGILYILTEFVFGKELLALNTILASVTSGLLNYALSTIWVFHKRQKNGNIQRFIVFTLIGAAGLALITGITWALTNWFNIHYMISNLTAQAIVFFFNFFMRKYIVYTLMSKESSNKN